LKFGAAANRPEFFTEPHVASRPELLARRLGPIRRLYRP
jgi:hypothetical protein